MTAGRRGVALAAAGLLLAAACSGGGAGQEAASPADTAVPVTAPAATPTPSPLTGLDSPNAARPALVVKIDNAAAARPQAGLDRADVVFEEVVEGGEVRFMAVFQSHDAEAVGPVRSVRPVDPDIVSSLGGLFAYSGGTAQFVSLIRRAPVTLVGFDQLGSRAYTKRRDRRAPSNLFTTTAALYAGAGTAAPPPPPPHFAFLAEGAPFEPAGASPALHLTVNISNRARADWDFDAATGVWRRGTNGTPHTVEGGTQLGFANVIVQFVAYTNTSARDQAGSPVPTAAVVGQGRALVLSAGRVVEASWSKPSATAVTEYRDAAGAPLMLTPGTTWVTLAPTGASTSLG